MIDYLDHLNSNHLLKCLIITIKDFQYFSSFDFLNRDFVQLSNNYYFVI